ncbi:MAG: hypothetical protein JSV28_02030, partial [Deltaproteobacteria bacterium]
MQGGRPGDHDPGGGPPAQGRREKRGVPKKGNAVKAGVLTVSDRSFRGEREDLSGPTLRRWLSERGVETTRHEIILDDRTLLATKLREWAD